MNLGNTSEEYDVAIVGAGPAGLFLADKLRDLNIIVLEEHKEVGKPLHCAGLLSLRGLRRISFTPRRSVQNKVRGAIFFSPSGLKLQVERPREEAVVVDRSIFDKELAEKVSDYIKLETKVLGASRKNGFWLLKTKKGVIRSKILVDAEGFRYSLSSSLGFRKPPENMLFPAIQADVEGVSGINQDLVEVYVGRRWAPGFFAWIIPLSDDEARVGLAAEKLPLVYLRNFMNKHPIASKKFRKARIRRFFGGRVVASGIYGRITGKNLLLIGDVAGQTKPTTGGGVIYSALAAQIASSIIKKELSQKSKELNLKEYERTWRRLFGKELFLMKIARIFMTQISDKNYDRIFKEMKKMGFESIAEKEGDIDFQYRVLKKIIAAPPLYTPQIPELFIAFVKALLT